eukprot:6172339-Pleurochrysis_carterae.AAC.1
MDAAQPTLCELAGPIGTDAGCSSFGSTGAARRFGTAVPAAGAPIGASGVEAGGSNVVSTGQRGAERRACSGDVGAGGDNCAKMGIRTGAGLVFGRSTSKASSV